MRLAHLSAPVKAFVLFLATAVVVACLAPLIGEPVEERSALWVVTDRALVRVGLDTDGTHRTTDPIPGAAAAEVRVRGNRLITARADAITSHALTPTLQPGEGTTVAMDAAAVSGLAASADADHIWLARPVPHWAGDAGPGNKNHSNGPGHGAGPASRITAFDRDLMPQWQRDLPGRIVALASAPADQDDTTVWVLQPRQLVGLDEAGATVVSLPLPPGPPAQAFVPLENQQLAVADVRGVRLLNAAGQLLANKRLIGTRDLHPLTGDEPAGLLWAVSRHRLALLDAQLQPVRTWHLPAQALARPVAASTVDPRDGSLWFVAGDSLYNAESDGALTEHRDLFAYLGTDPVTDLALYADTFVSELTVIEPEEPLVTNNDQPDLVLEYDDTGIGVDTDTLNVEQDGEPVDGTCETDTEAQRIECVIGPFDDGTHTITATIADYAGNESEPAEATYEIDTVAPEITIESPADGAYVNTEQVTVSGQLSETAELIIDGEPAGLDIDNRFEQVITLDGDGTSSIELEAIDGAGNRTTRTLTVTRDTVAPPMVTADGVTVEAGEEEGNVRITGADGSVEAEAEVVITNTRTGEEVVVQANAGGAFIAGIAGEVGDTYEIVVRDAAGNESGSEEVTGDTDDGDGSEIPPDPIDIAPPLPETGIPPFEKQISFLYEGANAIQQDVAPGTIEARRVSVLRGNVRNRAGDPIPGVKVTILNHPELGYTATQADGDFDLAVNGGGALTVEYKKDGYLPVQRTVSTQWNGWYHADDVVMIPLDDKVTTIDLTDDSQPFQVARGSVVTDADGTRQATVLFPAGTTAEITVPDGTKKQLSQLDVRATEYTVGDTGPAAMPGELPPASAYTYAVELSVDQALEQGVKVQGKDVVFNQPVPFYVDNFLDFPVGEPVPIGYYNNDTAAWVPHTNGRIVGILEEEGGLATLDVTGDGDPATVDELDKLGISDEERAQLAALYTPGESFWRMTTTHLSTWDHNWAYGPPESAEGPDVPEPETEDDDEPEDSDEEEDCEGCSISPQKQSLAETIEIAGTPYSLHYDSERAQGALDNSVTIPITDDEIPADLKEVRLTVTIAGWMQTWTFPAIPNQTHEFEWDGIGGFGRERHGSEVANIELSYVYPCTYYGQEVDSVPLGGGESVFGRFGGIANPIGTRSRCQGFEFPRKSRVVLESPLPPEATVGNWMLSPERIWDPGSGSTFGGDSGARVTNLSGVINTIAGTGMEGSSGDGGPAGQADLKFPHGMTVSPDGSVYFSEYWGSHRVRRINPDGVIETIAGTGIRGNASGDGGPATEARLDFPTGLALDDQGNLYIADQTNHSVRRVGSDGVIETAVGFGVIDFGGERRSDDTAYLTFPSDVEIGSDGSLYILEQQRLIRVTPNGQLDSVANDLQFPQGGMAVSDDGSIYVAETSRNRVIKITNDGRRSTVAGNGSSGYSGDGGFATQASLSSPTDVALDSGGNLYIADNFNAVVRRVTPAGTIDTVAGTSDYGFSGDGGPAFNAQLQSPIWLAVAPDDELYIADDFSHRIRAMTTTRRTNEATQIVPSRDGGSVDVFDGSRQQIETLNARTRGLIRSYVRDSQARLIRVIDGDGNTTSIERDSEGRAVAVVAPDGQRTTFVVNDGQLIGLTEPTGSAWSMAYTDDGLLTRIEKPGGSVNTFAYDQKGRLIEDVDSNGGGWQLARTELEDGYRTDMTSGEGRLYRFTTERPDAFTRVYSNEASDGTVTRRIHTDSSTAVERADGTVVTFVETPDPRFGMASPYVSERRVETPSGRVLQQHIDRSTAITDPDDLLSLQELHASVTTNGRTQTTEYDATARQWSSESPAGRTVTVLADEQSRPLQQTVPGIEPVHASYDDRGRVATVEQGGGGDLRATSFSYHDTGAQAGYLAAVTDALGRTTSFETDAAGRVTEQTLPDGRTIGYQYDGRGNLIALTPPGRAAHVFRYDGLDQRLDYTPPDLSGTETVTQYTYNLDRQIHEIERPGGEVVTFDYDPGGRLATRRMPAGDTTYGYDATTGQIASIDAPGSVGLQFQWDGFLPVTTDWTGPVSGSVSRDFDNNFWLTQESVNGNPVTFGYDDDGLLTGAGNLAVVRNADNGLITGTTQAAVAGTRAYNPFGELADRAVTADGTSVYDVEYTRDQLGRIVEEIETLDGETHTWQYDYDVAGRLVEVRRDGTPVHVYSYDANGNRTSHTGPAGTRTGTYDAQDRIAAYGDATYTHTPAGERASKTTSQGTTTYDYDAAGNLRGVTLPDGTEIEYLIDGQDRRVGKIVDGTLQKGWLYRDQLNPVAQLDADGNVTHHFVYGDKPNVPAYMVKDGTTYRIVSDHLGSVRLVIDTTSNEIVQRMDYSPFGEVIADTSPGFQPFGFAGGLYDRDTGLVRFGARDYDPEIGRWTAKDPIGFQGDGTNLYGYAIGDPINLVDMNGLQAGRAPANSGTYPGLRGLPQGLVNFSAGFGDTMSFGLTADIRAANGINGGVDPCSNAYAAGRYSAYGAAAAAGGAAAARYGPAAARAAFSRLPASVQAQYAKNLQTAVDVAEGALVPGAPPGSPAGTFSGAASMFVNVARSSL